MKAYDNGGLSSECPLTIYIVEESHHHTPVVQPLTITLNTLMGEFLGGKIGAIRTKGDVSFGDRQSHLLWIIWSFTMSIGYILAFKIIYLLQCMIMNLEFRRYIEIFTNKFAQLCVALCSELVHLR